MYGEANLAFPWQTTETFKINEEMAPLFQILLAIITTSENSGIAATSNCKIRKHRDFHKRSSFSNFRPLDTTMTKTITIYADYVCPYCLLAAYFVSNITARANITIRWRPFELRPYPEPTLRIEGSYLPDIWKRSVYPLAKQLGIPIKLPNMSPQPRTEKAFEVFAMAGEQGLGHDFSMRVMRAFFQEEKDIGKHQVLAELAAEIGLDRHAVLTALTNKSYSNRHSAAIKHAIEEARISSVPTIIVGQKLFTGVSNTHELQKAIELLEGKKNSAYYSDS